MDTKTKDLKSNEEIIEEITRDLENSCSQMEDDISLSEDNSKLEGRSSNLEKNCGDSIETNEENMEDKKLLDDFIDEELLKDRELGLSKSEKEALKHESEKLKNEGNNLFRSGDYVQARLVYTQGLQACPLAYSKERAILYANRAAAKFKREENHESAISDCTKAIELNPNYVKAYNRRAQLYEKTDKLDEALADFKKVLTFDATHTEANTAVQRLPPLIDERNEKLKTEMLGKLKDLGNMVLQPFGLSTNNFELQKNPDSDGYSIKFKQNPS